MEESRPQGWRHTGLVPSLGHASRRKGEKKKKKGVHHSDVNAEASGRASLMHARQLVPAGAVCLLLPKYSLPGWETI